jgi:hypothetical protein
MDQSEPFFVDVKVPEAVLLSVPAKAAGTMRPDTCDAVWYKADQTSLTCNDAGVVQAWRAQEGRGTTATPVKPNNDNLRLSGTGGLMFDAEINAGLVVENALFAATTFTLAVRYSSDHGEARSLLTLNPSDYDSYLFLAEKDGVISWQDQQDHAALSQPAPKGGGWIIAGCNHGRLSLATAPDGGMPSAPLQSEVGTAEIQAALTGACDLFIGCRSHRKGILKTLGSARIHDVLLWVDQDYCSANQTPLAAVLRHCESQGTTA